MADAITFETHPSRYRHLRLEIAAASARIILKVDEQAGLRPDYLLKLNSYDLSVDIELADAIQRLRFEHPGVAVVTLTSAIEGTFSAGANIFMLAGSDHGFKVNFCKFTNETRLALEDASTHSGQHYLAAVNGIASGGGYELALACDEIILVDDRRSAVSLPELPFLAVLPGTGGLTRLVDKRHVRRDHADIFATLAEGARGQRAVAWKLADAAVPPSQFDAYIARRVANLIDPERATRVGVALDALAPAVSDEEIRYRHVTLRLDPRRRLAELALAGPAAATGDRQARREHSADWYPLRLFRELDDALLRLRFNHPEIGLVLIKSRGDLEAVLAYDRALRADPADASPADAHPADARPDDWFVGETRLMIKRTLKRLDLTAKSFFAVIEEGSCFGGFLLELALAADRVYMKAVPGAIIATSPLNGGALPMSNGVSRLATRFLDDPDHAQRLAQDGRYDPAAALEAGLVTAAPDALDWDEELRLAADERLSLSPDGLTAMEANLRFAGPETMETKIFGRLTAWQNWIFQRPNAVGAQGALKLYGRPERPQFDWKRT